MGGIEMESEKIQIPIESMAKVFEKFHISYNKLIDLYIDQTEVDNIVFEASQISKYLSKEELAIWKSVHIEKTLLSRGEKDYGNRWYEIAEKYKEVTRNFRERIRREGKCVEDELICPELLNMLITMERRPGMYLGKCYINRLFDFLGNALYGAQCIAKVDLDPNDIWQLFNGWLKEKYKVKGNYSWCQVILQIEPDEGKAIGKFFEEFWIYFEEMKQYRRKKDIINYLYERLGLVKEQREERRLVEELIAYPNQATENFFHKNCYIISVLKVCEEKYVARRQLKVFYIEQNLKRIWVRYKDSTLFQDLEEFLKDNEKWYES